MTIKLLLPSLLLSFSALVQQVLASKYITIEQSLPSDQISVTASSTFDDLQSSANLINGSGMLGNTHDASSGASTMWHTTINPEETVFGGVKAKCWVRFDFKIPTLVEKILVWNHNQAGLVNRGFRNIVILGSLDGRNWKAVAKAELPVALGTATKPSGIKIKTGKKLKAIAIVAKSNWGGNVFGLSEVKFLQNKKVAIADLAFPKNLQCQPQPFYRHRKDGTAGREILIRLPKTRLYTDAEITVTSGDLSEKTRIAANPLGTDSIPVILPDGLAEKQDASVTLTLTSFGKTISQVVTVPKLRKWTVYIYPHSHVDIGYTNIHSNIEIIHKRNLVNGIKLAEKTKDYPEGARYVWNPECTWPVERYLATATPAEKEKVYDAIRKGYLAIDAGYVSVNTSVTADEEFPSLFSYAKKLEKKTGVKVDTIGQFDVPGMSWGMVPMAAQHGMRYVFCPFNGGDRTGLSPEASFRPFWWEGPDGKSKVLFLQPGDYTPGARLKGYKYWPSMAGQLDPEKILRIVKTDNPRANFIDGYLWGMLERLGKDELYPYDIFPMTWAMADNTPIDADLPDAVKSWNEDYAYPRLIISSAHTIMNAFDKKYGDQIPTKRGDFTEFWSDGLGSSAKMTSMNRVSKERLIQADTLWSMLRPEDAAPRKTFAEIWRRILMGSEHTWCYMNPSLSHMQDPIWESKKAHFIAADQGSRQVLGMAAKKVIVSQRQPSFTVFNTLSWKRSGLITLSRKQSLHGNTVVGLKSGKEFVTQRLANGCLAFVAEDVPAFGSLNYTVKSLPNKRRGLDRCKVTRVSLENSHLKLRVDSNTGDIVSLINKESGHDYVDSNAPCGINSYRYLLGTGKPASAGPQYASAKEKGSIPLVASKAKATGPTEVKISILEKGPLVASLLIESKADGCKSLTRVVRIIAGQDHVEIDNLVDKIATTTKEGIHFGFAFNIPDPRTQVDIPWGIMEVEADQLPFGNRNWICFQRWLDVANDKRGVTWCSLDAPTFEYGAMTANIIGSGTGSPAWIRKLKPSSTIYSWALNNHWHTNFPLSQAGKIQFRYRLRPHETDYNAIQSNRFGLGQTQPLIVVPTEGEIQLKPRIVIHNPNVFVTIIKTSVDGKSTIVRLRSVSDEEQTIKPSFPQLKPQRIRESDATEVPGKELTGDIKLPPFGVVTLYLENT